jgi:mRNA interferase RelE/StbE
VNVEFHPDVHKQLQQLPRKVFAAALQVIIGLSHDPRPAGVVKLVGSPNDWRVRIGEYRIVYAVDDATSTVTVMQVRHRREVYR